MQSRASLRAPSRLFLPSSEAVSVAFDSRHPRCNASSARRQGRSWFDRRPVGVRARSGLGATSRRPHPSSFRLAIAVGVGEQARTKRRSATPGSSFARTCVRREDQAIRAAKSAPEKSSWTHRSIVVPGEVSRAVEPLRAGVPDAAFSASSVDFVPTRRILSCELARTCSSAPLSSP
jgi:hypothetical protein